MSFGSSSKTSLTNDLTAGFAVSQLSFASGASAYSISGNAITLGTNSAATVISNASTATQVINNNISFGNAAQTVVLTAGGGNVVLNGNIAGTGTLSAMNVTGSGTLTLSGSNSYGAGYNGANGTTIGSGATVLVTNTNGLGGSIASSTPWNNLAAVYINSGGVLDLRSDSSVIFGPGNGQGYSIASYTPTTGTATLNIGSLSGTAVNQTITVGNLSITGNGGGTPGILLVTGSNGYRLNAGFLRFSDRGTFVNNLAGGVTLAGVFGHTQAGWAQMNFAGSGTTTVTGNVIRNLLGGASNYTTQSFNKSDTGVLVLNGAINDWGTNTTITGGTLSIGGVITDLYNHSALTLSNTNTGVGNDVALILRSSWTVGGLVTGTIAAASSGSNTTTINLSGTDVTLAVKGNSYSSSNYGGTIAGTGGLTLLSRSRSNTWADQALNLYGKNTYSGDTTLNGGSLVLDFSNAAATTTTNIINNVDNSSTLVLGGGGLTVKGKSSAVNSQRFNGAEVTRGGSVVTVSQNSATSVLLSLGAITRNSAGGTVDFINPAGGVTTANGITTTTANTNGILGGWATVSGSNWATVNGNGNIVGLSAYTNDTWAAGNNTNVTTSSALTSATTNSLRFHNAAANTLTLDGTSTITSGGILVTSAVGSNASAINGGTLLGASGQDLVVIQNNTSGALTIGSVIADNGGASGLTKSGSGVLALTANNTYTGATNINGGVIQIGSASALGNASASTNSINFNGNGALISTSGTADLGLNRSTLESTSGTYDLGVNRNIALNGAGTIQVDAGNLTVSGVISGAATLNKTGTGTLTLTGANTFNSQLTVNAGILNIQNGLALGSESLGTNITSYDNTPTVVANGATMQLQGNIHVGSETIMITGTGADGQSGALVNTSGYNTIGRNITASTNLYIYGDSTIAVDAGSLNILQSINVGGTTTTSSGGLPWILTLTGQGYGTIGSSAYLSGIGGLVKNGTGTWSILNSGNGFMGGVTLNSGVLSVYNVATVSTGSTAATANALGKSSNAASNLVFAGNSTLRILNSSNTDRNFTIADGVTATIDLSGTTTSLVNVTLSGGATGTNGLSTGGLTKTGIGTLTVTGTQGYTGATTVASGAMTLDYNASATVSNIINSSSALILNGGGLIIKGKLNATNSQTFNGLTVGSGASTITLSGTPTNLSVALGGITRNAGGTLNFSVTPVSGTSVTTTAVNDSTGILGTWATTGTGTALNYAAVSSGSIGAYTGATTAATASDLTGTTGTVNYNLSTYTGSIASSLSANTIRYTGAATGTTAVTSSFTVNGLMNAGSGVWTIGNSVGSGTLTIGSSKELVINTNAQQIRINSAIVDSADGPSSVTITSVNNAGVVMLYGTNSTYSGATNINAGIVYLNQIGGLGNSSVINLNGGTLNPTQTMDFGSTRTLNVGENGGSFAINPGATVTVSGTVNLSKNGSYLTVSGANANSSAVFSGVVAGDGGLWKSGAAAMVLSNANTYRGETVVNAGILNIRNNYALGTNEGTTSVLSGGTLQLQNNINVGEAVTLYNTAVLQNVSGNNTWSGNITLAPLTYNSWGTSTITSDAGTLTLAGNVDLVYNNLIVGGAGDTTISGVVGNSQMGIQKNGAGTLTLSASNSYTGATTVSGGVLAITNDGALGAAYDGSIGGYLTTAGGSGYVSTTTLVAVAAPTTAGGITATPGSIAIQGGGSAFNTVSTSGQDGSGYIYNPAVTVTSSGTGVGAAVTALVKGLLTLDGGTLRTDADITSNRAVVLTSNNGTIDTNGHNSTFSGVFNNGGSGSGGLTKAGAGSLKLSGTSIYAGATNVTGGTLVVSGSLTATSAVSTIANSILSIENGGINSAATITSAGTVQGKGNVGSLSISAGGKLNPGQTTETTQTLGTLTATGNVSFADDTSIFSVRLSNTGNDRLVMNGGSLTLNHVTLALDVSAYTMATAGDKFTIVSGGAGLTGVTFNNVFSQGTSITAANGLQFGISYAAGASGNDIVLEVIAVPEPATWGMLVTGVGMLFGLNRMRRNRAAR